VLRVTLPDTAAFARALGFAAAFVCIGAIPARALLRRSWREGVDEPARAIAQARLTYLTFAATLLLLLTVLFALHIQAEQLVDEGERLGAAQYDLALASGWGAGWKAQLIASLLALVAWWPSRGRAIVGPRLAPIAALGLAATLPLTGHAQALHLGSALGELTGTLHVLGGALWLGTLALLALVGWVGDDAGRGSRVARLIAAFSPVALTGASLTALSGVIFAWQTVGSWQALTSSSYGRTLLVKLSCLVGVAALGAWNWKVIQPRLAKGTGDDLLRRSAATELLLGAMLLIVTALLVMLPAPGLE
jgi:putative copper export protein